MKPGAILIDRSRGAMLDEAALADPTVADLLGTIALDMFTTEPLPLDSALRDLPVHILTNYRSRMQENLRMPFATAAGATEGAIADTLMPTAFPAQKRQRRRPNRRRAGGC